MKILVNLLTIFSIWYIIKNSAYEELENVHSQEIEKLHSLNYEEKNKLKIENSKIQAEKDDIEVSYILHQPQNVDFFVICCHFHWVELTTLFLFYLVKILLREIA